MPNLVPGYFPLSSPPLYCARCHPLNAGKALLVIYDDELNMQSFCARFSTVFVQTFCYCSALVVLLLCPLSYTSSTTSLLQRSDKVTVCVWKRLSTIPRVRETRILDTGSSRTTKASLTQVQRDRLAFEEEQRATNIHTFSHTYMYHPVLTLIHVELTAKTQQLLAEAALEVGRASTGDPAAPSTDFGNWDYDHHHPNGADSDDDEET
ncbi:hypothetical protein DFH29DRAFT_150908 [Suillus ampliporus]|nr:hypothetical protein DFH29DRAFT_150908 [Suillus ampliporus]